MEKKAVPLIAEGAESQVLEMLREGVKRHEKAIEYCESLTEKLEADAECSRLDPDDVPVIIEALFVLAAKHEDDLEKVKRGVAELEKYA